jgi:hypothetical protein
MKKFISSIVALILGAALVVSMPVSAATWKPFLHGVNSPAELAGKIETSLKQNPKGTSMLDSARCKKDGSCATPLNYLEALQQVNPGAHLTGVAQVPDFLRTLKVIDAPTGEYWISCLKPSGQGMYKAVLHCLSRSFKKGEKAWIDAKSGVIVFASDCTNVVEKPVPLKQTCAEDHFFARPGDTVIRFAVLGPAAIEDDCFAIKKVGETEFKALFRDECASEHCTFAASEAFLKKKVRKIASYALEPGEHVVRVPAHFAKPESPYVVTYCIERTKMPWPEKPTVEYTHAQRGEYIAQRDEYIKQRDEWIDGHSDSVNVWGNAYHVGSDGVPRAFIYASEREVPASETVKMYWRYKWVAEHPQQYSTSK